MSKIDIQLQCNYDKSDSIRFMETPEGTISVYIPNKIVELTKIQIIDLAEEIKKTL